MSGSFLYSRTCGLLARYYRPKPLTTRPLSESSKWRSAALNQRSIIRVSGAETPVFLQGLITNDINSLENQDCPSLYCLFLNTGGRALFDTIISRGFEPNQLFLEVDERVSKAVVKHLSMYRVRRKIKIELANDLQVHCIFQDQALSNGSAMLVNENPDKISSTFCDGGLREPLLPPLTNEPEEMRCFPDPRVDILGYRLISSTNSSLGSKLPFQVTESDPADYTKLRCLTGVAEGKDEIIPAKALPLEYNLDYLRGVSFHKGCYIGQELTARTHHTGVIRKRILPFKLSGQPSGDTGLEFDATIVNEEGRTVGKVRQTQGDYGLGLIRLKEAFEAKSLSCGDAAVSVGKPLWWPQETTEGSGGVTEKSDSKMS